MTTTKASAAPGTTLIALLCASLFAACQRSASPVPPPPASVAPRTPAPIAPSPLAASGGDVTPVDKGDMDPNDAAAVTTVETRLPRSGHSFAAHRIPIEQLPAAMSAAGADLEVTYVATDVEMQVIVLVLRDPATALKMAPVLNQKAIPSSTWVVATWSGRGVLMLVSDTSSDSADGVDHVKSVIAALSS